MLNQGGTGLHSLQKLDGISSFRWFLACGCIGLICLDLLLCLKTLFFFHKDNAIAFKPHLANPGEIIPLKILNLIIPLLYNIQGFWITGHGHIFWGPWFNAWWPINSKSYRNTEWSQGTQALEVGVFNQAEIKCQAFVFWLYVFCFSNRSNPC